MESRNMGYDGSGRVEVVTPPIAFGASASPPHLTSHRNEHVAHAQHAHAQHGHGHGHGTTWTWHNMDMHMHGLEVTLVEVTLACAACIGACNNTPIREPSRPHHSRGTSHTLNQRPCERISHQTTRAAARTSHQTTRAAARTRHPCTRDCTEPDPSARSVYAVVLPSSHAYYAVVLTAFERADKRHQVCALRLVHSAQRLLRVHARRKGHLCSIDVRHGPTASEQ
jgi:hypothetical protein